MVSMVFMEESECFLQHLVKANSKEGHLVIVHVVPSVTKFCKRLLIEYLSVELKINVAHPCNKISFEQAFFSPE